MVDTTWVLWDDTTSGSRVCVVNSGGGGGGTGGLEGKGVCRRDDDDGGVDGTGELRCERRRSGGNLANFAVPVAIPFNLRYESTRITSAVLSDPSRNIS